MTYWSQIGLILPLGPLKIRPETRSPGPKNYFWNTLLICNGSILGLYMNLGKAYNQGTLCYGFRGPRSCFLAPPTVGSRGADPVTSDLWFVCPSVCLCVNNLEKVDLLLQFWSYLYETRGIVRTHQYENFVGSEILNFGPPKILGG